MPSSKPSTHPLIIVGAGPAGLAAAIYAAREDLHPIVLEKAVVGGLAAITATIDNYPGFEQGISGLELASRLEAHAKRFGTDIRTGVEVTRLHRAGDAIELTTSQGPLTAEAVLLATGSIYRQLGVPGESELIGRGVHFCATCDAPLYRGKDLLVVGGGNSALQETHFIAKFARHVTLLVRGANFDGTAVLREQLLELPNVGVHFNTEITAVQAHNDRFAGVATRNTATDEAREFPADGLFEFVGQLAGTEPFHGTIKLDDHDFIVTGPDFTTNVPGVFAAGDVRSGSDWQIATAVGEGVNAALDIRDYLVRKHHPRPAGKTAA